LHDRAVLAQATGVLMVRRDCTGAEAWAYLHGTADQTGVPVAGLAGQIVASIESTA
jgi:AmiR/NasT family two-component response regulator